MRRSSFGIVPRTVTAVDEFGLWLVPAAQFYQSEEPPIQVPAADVRPHVANLLLTGSPDFLNVCICQRGGVVARRRQLQVTKLLGVTPSQEIVIPVPGWKTLSEGRIILIWADRARLTTTDLPSSKRGQSPRNQPGPGTSERPLELAAYVAGVFTTSASKRTEPNCPLSAEG